MHGNMRLRLGAGTVKIRPEIKVKFGKWLRVHRQSDYDSMIIDFAIAWANLMEKHIAEGKSLKSILLKDSFLVDDRGIQATEFSHAVRIICTFWVYSQEFEGTYNKLYGGGNSD